MLLVCCCWLDVVYHVSNSSGYSSSINLRLRRSWWNGNGLMRIDKYRWMTQISKRRQPATKHSCYNKTHALAKIRSLNDTTQSTAACCVVCTSFELKSADCRTLQQATQGDKSKTFAAHACQTPMTHNDTHATHRDRMHVKIVPSNTS